MPCKIFASGSVAPFAGAWIEITPIPHLFIVIPSLPSRERGLKFKKDNDLVIPLTSLPSRERGLKSEKLIHNQLDQGRSLRGSVD